LRQLRWRIDPSEDQGSKREFQGIGLDGVS